MEYRNLKGISLETIHATLVEAFADHPMDISRFTFDQFRLRVIKNAVDLECSAGAFDGDRLVGVTLVGLDILADGTNTAFDVATGIIATHRGRGLAGGMFDSLRPAVKKAGATRFLLEVLQENKAAIRAYEKTGFSIRREFVSYTWSSSRFPREKTWPGRVRRTDVTVLREFDGVLDWRPSWENRIAGILRVGDEMETYAAFAGDSCVGVLVQCPLLNWIMCLHVSKDTRRQGVATELLRTLAKSRPDHSPPMIVHNVDASDRGMIAFLKKRGFVFFVDQFEMGNDLG